MQTRVHIFHEVVHPDDFEGWQLCFQWCRYMYSDGEVQDGYRFIWRTDKGKLQPARGQARIPSIKHIKELVMLAENGGWGNKE